jgi:hypothetical protein
MHQPRTQGLNPRSPQRKDPGWGWSRDTMASGGEGKVSNYTFPLENVTFQLRGVCTITSVIRNTLETC